MKKPVSNTVAACLVVFFSYVTIEASAEDNPKIESVTIKMVLKNTQAKAVRDAKGATVVVELTKAQKDLICLRASQFKGHTIRVSASQLFAGNKIRLLILKPSSGTPVLRVLSPNR